MILRRHESRVPEMKGDVGGGRFVRDGSQDQKEDQVAADKGQCQVIDEDVEISRIIGWEGVYRAHNVAKITRG